MKLTVLRVVSLLLLFVSLCDSCCERLSPWNYWFSFSTWDKGQRAALIWKSTAQLEPGGSTPCSTPTTQAKCQALPAQHCWCHSFLFCNVQTARWRSGVTLFEQSLQSRIFPKEIGQELMEMHVSVVLHSAGGIENAARYGRKWGRNIFSANLAGWAGRWWQSRKRTGSAGQVELLMSWDWAVQEEG